jgi:hypothetical protein
VHSTVLAGTSSTLRLDATIGKPSLISGPIYAVVLDPSGLLVGTPSIVQMDANRYAVTANVRATLGVGRHEGNFDVRLCRDAACASVYPGGTATLAYQVDVTPQQISATPLAVTSATIRWKGTAAPVPVSVTASPIPWTAISSVPWLVVTRGSGTGAGQFTVSYASSELPVGEHVGTVLVRSADGPTFEVPFGLTVLPAQFALSAGVASFTAINGEPIAPQDVAFTLDNLSGVAWSATASAPWLRFTPSAGTTPGTIRLQPDPAVGALASGQHTANLILQSAGSADHNVTTQLTLLRPTLLANSPSVALGGERGRDLSEMLVPITLNTGANTWPFSLSALPSWLSSTTAVGRVGQANSALKFSRSGTTPAGTHTAAVTVTAQVNGDTVQLPLSVTLHADQRRLLASDWGIGFSSTPAGAVLSQSITIRDNLGGLLDWNASSDRSWLTLSRASGQTADGAASLTLTVNPAAVPNDAISTARVTLTSSTSGVEPAVVRVAFWKSGSSLSTTVDAGGEASHVIADPIRPLVYAHNEQAAIDVYNFHTAQKVATIAAGSQLGAMGISADAQTLYAIDQSANEIVLIDLPTLARKSAWPLVNAFDASATTVTVARTNGVDVVFLATRSAYKDGRSLGVPLDPNPGGAMVASRDGKRLYVASSGGAHAYDLDYSEVAGGSLQVSRVGYVLGEVGQNNWQDIALSPDDATVYTAYGSPYQCTTAQVADFPRATYPGLPGGPPLAGGSAYPNNIVVTRDGRAICGRNSSGYGEDFWVHPTNGGAPIAYFIPGDLIARSLSVSSDGSIAVGAFYDPFMSYGRSGRLVFVPIGM